MSAAILAPQASHPTPGADHPPARGSPTPSLSSSSLLSTASQSQVPAYAQHYSGAPLSRAPSLTPSASLNMLPAQSVTSSYIQTSAGPGHSFSQHQPPSQPFNAASSQPLTTKPAVIEYGNYRFCVHDAPTDSNLSSYIDFLRRKKTVALVRACEPTYDKQPLVAAGITVHEMPFQDGSPPPDSMIAHWLKLCQDVFGPPTGATGKEKKESKRERAADGSSTSSSKSSSNAIAVHCVAGLGRAPVLVCIALIESGMTWMAAVELVRKKRRGALNITQLQYLETYKPRGKKEGCTVM